MDKSLAEIENHMSRIKSGTDNGEIENNSESMEYIIPVDAINQVQDKDSDSDSDGDPDIKRPRYEDMD